MLKFVHCLLAAVVMMVLAGAASAGDYRFPAQAAPVKLPPPLLKSTTEPLVRSESATPRYVAACPAGQVCTVCVAGCMAGQPHVLQSRTQPLPSTRSNETAAEKADRERTVSQKPGWAQITCGNDGCSGRGAPRRPPANPDYNISVNRYY